MHFSKNYILSKKATHFHKPIATHSQSVITYCQQKNPLRVRTKLHIHLCKAWSSQRFKSLPSILCKIVVVQSRLPNKRRSFYQNHRFDRRFEPGSQGETPSAFWFFLQKQKERKNVSLSGTFHCMESMPLSGQHATRAMEFRGFANLEVAHTGGGITKAASRHFTYF